MANITDADLAEVQAIRRGAAPMMAVSRLVEIACDRIDRVRELEVRIQSIHDDLVTATDRCVQRIIKDMEILDGCRKTEAAEKTVEGKTVRRLADRPFEAWDPEDDPTLIGRGFTAEEAMRNLDRLLTRKKLVAAEARIKELEAKADGK